METSTMALTMDGRRYQEIRRKVMEQRRLAAKSAEAEVVDWDALPHFANVDDFFDFLDSHIPPETRAKLPPRKRR
jgi:hypothetical protein